MNPRRSAHRPVDQSTRQGAWRAQISPNRGFCTRRKHATSFEIIRSMAPPLSWSELTHSRHRLDRDCIFEFPRIGDCVWMTRCSHIPLTRIAFSKIPDSGKFQQNRLQLEEVAQPVHWIDMTRKAIAAMKMPDWTQNRMHHDFCNPSNRLPWDTRLQRIP